MTREVSAGGVVVRSTPQGLELAVIRPRGKRVWALPKGHVDPGESADVTAAREVREETGLVADLKEKLGDVRYTYTFRGQRVFKVVSFYLFDYRSGTIDDLEPAMRVEVDQASWVPLKEAERILTYQGEREMAVKALQRLEGALSQAKK